MNELYFKSLDLQSDYIKLDTESSFIPVQNHLSYDRPVTQCGYSCFEPSKFYSVAIDTPNYSGGPENDYELKVLKLFRTENKKKIFSLLNHDEQLFKSINEIYYKLVDYFESNDISLKPDEEDGDSINIMISARTTPNLTLKALNEFNKNYFLEINPRLKNRINIEINQL